MTTTMDILTKRKSALRVNVEKRDMLQRMSHFFFGTERKGNGDEGFSF